MCLCMCRISFIFMFHQISRTWSSETVFRNCIPRLQKLNPFFTVFSYLRLILSSSFLSSPVSRCLFRNPQNLSFRMTCSDPLTLLFFFFFCGVGGGVGRNFSSYQNYKFGGLENKGHHFFFFSIFYFRGEWKSFGKRNIFLWEDSSYCKLFFSSPSFWLSLVISHYKLGFEFLINGGD